MPTLDTLWSKLLILTTAYVKYLCCYMFAICYELTISFDIISRFSTHVVLTKGQNNIVKIKKVPF